MKLEATNEHGKYSIELPNAITIEHYYEICIDLAKAMGYSEKSIEEYFGER